MSELQVRNHLLCTNLQQVPAEIDAHNASATAHASEAAPVV